MFDCKSRSTGQAFIGHAPAPLVGNGLSIGCLAFGDGFVIHVVRVKAL